LHLILLGKFDFRYVTLETWFLYTEEYIGEIETALERNSGFRGLSMPGENPQLENVVKSVLPSKGLKHEYISSNIWILESRFNIAAKNLD
jgi:hypothetical protein